MGHPRMLQMRAGPRRQASAAPRIDRLSAESLAGAVARDLTCAAVPLGHRGAEPDAEAVCALHRSGRAAAPSHTMRDQSSSPATEPGPRDRALGEDLCAAGRQATGAARQIPRGAAFRTGGWSARVIVMKIGASLPRGAQVCALRWLRATSPKPGLLWRASRWIRWPVLPKGARLLLYRLPSKAPGRLRR